VLLGRGAWLYARGRPVEQDPAWPRRLRVVDRPGPALRAHSHGGPVWPVVVLRGPWAHQPPDTRRAVLAHEASHLRRGDMLWLPALTLGLAALLPDGFGSYLLAVAVGLSVNRRLELRADADAAALVSPAAARAMLHAVGEDRQWPRVARWPVLCLFLTHPLLQTRLAAVARRAPREP
jgi:Zn-dependent protease with chaperone function